LAYNSLNCQPPKASPLRLNLALSGIVAMNRDKMFAFTVILDEVKAARLMDLI
jgi:hypothetical protein